MGDVNTINAYFASVSTDPQYSSQSIMDELDRQLRLSFPSESPQVPIAQYCQHDITVRLAKIKKTANGADGLPYWVLNECAAELGDIVADLMNLFINKGNVPASWKHAHVTPVSKVAKINSPADLRPISLTQFYIE